MNFPCAELKSYMAAPLGVGWERGDNIGHSGDEIGLRARAMENWCRRTPRKSEGSLKGLAKGLSLLDALVDNEHEARSQVDRRGFNFMPTDKVL
jgi:hypothetical protein